MKSVIFQKSALRSMHGGCGHTTTAPLRGLCELLK